MNQLRATWSPTWLQCGSNFEIALAIPSKGDLIRMVLNTLNSRCFPCLEGTVHAGLLRERSRPYLLPLLLAKRHCIVPANNSYLDPAVLFMHANKMEYDRSVECSVWSQIDRSCAKRYFRIANDARNSGCKMRVSIYGLTRIYMEHTSKDAYIERVREIGTVRLHWPHSQFSANL